MQINVYRSSYGENKATSMASSRVDNIASLMSMQPHHHIGILSRHSTYVTAMLADHVMVDEKLTLLGMEDETVVEFKEQL